MSTIINRNIAMHRNQIDHLEKRCERYTIKMGDLTNKQYTDDFDKIPVQERDNIVIDYGNKILSRANV